MNKKILIVSGIAGCGMSSFSSEILRRIDFNLKYPVTTTSRGKRGDEKDGVHYHFISPVEFREKIENDEFIEFENVYGSVFYGTEEKELSVDGHNIILVTSLETALKIKKRYGQDCLTIFIRPSHLSDLSEWLFRENIYTGEKIEELVAKAKKEVKLTPKFDVICEKNRKNEIANYDQVLLKIANFLFCGSIIIDSSISGIDMIGYVISSLDNEYRKGTNPNYIFRGVTAFYGDSNTDDFTHVIKSGHQVRMDVSGSRDHKKSVIYLRTLLNAARRQFPKTYTGSDLEILSDIQHYGGATCLIDFSQNILTALWFACQGDFNQTGYLYCYNISEELKNKRLAEISYETALNIRFDLVEVVNAILYKLKSGCQWRLLPIGHLFSGEGPRWKTIFHHYRKWCKKEEWQKIYSRILSRYKDRLDLSLSHIDGSHTPVYRGGEKAEYQGRKKRCTTNSLFLSDNQGIPLAMSEPQAGNHADIYEIDERVDEIADQLLDADIAVDGLFSNLDAGFDGKDLRSALISHGIIPNVCPNPRNGGETKEDWLYDEEMYKERWKIERTNAWMDGFKAVLNRFDTTVSSWKGWNFLAFIVIFLKKFHKSN